MVNWWIYEESFIFASSWVHKEVREWFVEHLDGITLIVWEEEDRMQRTESDRDIRHSEEGRESLHWEGIEDQHYCPYHRPETGVELWLIQVYITECLFQDLSIE